MFKALNESVKFQICLDCSVLINTLLVTFCCCGKPLRGHLRGKQVASGSGFQVQPVALLHVNPHMEAGKNWGDVRV